MSDKPPPAGERSHRLQIALAVIGVVGTLGTALIANWDKVFGPSGEGSAATKAPAGATGTQGAQSPVVTGVTGNVTIQIGGEQAKGAPTPQFDGRWTTTELVNPYDRATVSMLDLDLQVVGDTVVGSLTERFPMSNGERRFSSPVVEGRVAGPKIVFETRSEVYAGGGTRPLVTRYIGSWQDGEIRFTRQNDSPGGGAIETFVARRP